MFGAWSLALVTLPGPAAADELPQNACGIKMPFALFEDLLVQQIQGVLDQASDAAGVALTADVDNIQFVPQLGRLGYTTEYGIWQPVQLPVGSPNNTTTSNDDFIEIIIPITVAGLANFDLHVAVAFPQDRPPMVDANGGTTCMCRTFTDDGAHITRYVIQTLPPCPEPEENPDHTPECHTPFWYNFANVPSGFTFDFYGYSSAGWQGAGWSLYNTHYVDSGQIEGIVDSQFNPVACEDHRTVMCSTLTPAEREANGITDGDVLSTHACVLCIDEHWDETPVWIDPNAFPNLFGVEIWYSGLANELLRTAFQHAGFRDPHVAGQPFERSCCLQNELADLIQQVNGLLGPVDLPEYGNLDLAQLIQESGGVRISALKEAIYLMIPPVNVYSSDDFILPNGKHSCTHTHETWNLTGEAYRISVFGWMDAPKVLDYLLKSSAGMSDYTTKGMRVTCNHAEPCPPGVPDYDGDGLCSCQELGITDLDGDGFCDDVDLCIHTFSGANCDSDGDGYGDAPQGMLDRCLRQFPSQLPRAQYGQTLEAARQFYCGGCDNCPGVYNPRAFGATYVANAPNPLLWPWWQVALVDEDGLFLNPLPDIPLPSRQEDRDGDSIGDACDEDADGDGIHVEHDCDDLNYRIHADLDGDGVCDHIGFFCDEECNASNNLYWPFDLNDCLARCSSVDNCAGNESSVCAGAVGCSTTEAAESDVACAAAGDCTFIAGPNWPHSSLGNRCLPGQTWCSDVFANQDQSDVDFDDVGDKCDWVNVGMPTLDIPTDYAIEPEWQSDPIGHVVVHQHINTGGLAQVQFRARGGQPTVSGGQLNFNPEIRTHTQIGACHCDVNFGGNTWPIFCFYPEICPGGQDHRPTQTVTAWTPINSPQCSDPNLPYSGDPVYEQDYNTYGICFAREMEFSRDEATNHHGLSWRWTGMRSFPDPSTVIGSQYDRYWLEPSGNRSTMIRVAWPNGDTINYLDPHNSETAMSITSRRFLHRMSFEELSTFHGSALSPLPAPFAVAPVGPFDPLSPVARGGYLMVADLIANRPTLLTLSSGAPKVSGAFEASFSDPVDFSAEIAGAAGAVHPELVGGVAGTAAGVFVYQGPASPAKLFIGFEVSDSTRIDLVSTESLWEAPAPEAYNVKLLFIPSTQELLLFGSLVSGGPRDRIWRLRLTEGTWEGPAAPPSLSGLHGYSATYDPVRRRVLLFGGATQTYVRPPTSEDPGVPSFHATSTIRAVDLRSLVVTVVASAGPAPPDLARYHHGAGLDAAGRALYVQGGERDGVVLDDAWRFDLRTHQWLALGGAGPAAVEPLVRYDHDRRALWVGDFTGANLLDGLDLWGQDRTGSWYQTRALSVPSATVWPVTDVYRQDHLALYLWSSDSGASQPGQLWLALLDAAEPVLGLAARVLPDGRMITSEPDSAGQQAAGFLCPVGQRCSVEVLPLPGSGSQDMVPYQLDVVEAAPVLETFTHPVASIRGLALWGNEQLVVVGPAKLKVLDRHTLSKVGKLQGPDIAGATAVAACGSNLCVSRNRLQGLVIVDIGDGAAPQVVARQFTSGLAKDIAVQGRTVYLAQGVLGVGVYDVGDPAAPTQVELFQPPAGWPVLWHRVVSVALLGNRLLAVAEHRGTVHLYDLSAGRVHVGSFSVPGCNTIERIRFVGKHLWVLSGGAGTVSVYGVIDPAAPQLLGSFSQEARQRFRAVYAGIRRYTYGASLLSVERLEPLVP